MTPPARRISSPFATSTTSAPPPLSPCKLDYDTLGVGAGLTVTGVVLLGAGVVLMAIPERRARPTPPAAAAATP